MRFTILTLFPEYFDSPLRTSLVGRARTSGLLDIQLISLRDFGEGKYKAVDDRPYGGGVGMVMMPTILERALDQITGGRVDALADDVQAFRSKNHGEDAAAALTTQKTEELPHVVYLSPQGALFGSPSARALSQRQHVVLICGHYEGIDERAIEALVHEEVSIGNYVLTGGEPAACVVVDAVSRFIPGVVGDQNSVDADTFEGHRFSNEMLAGGLKYPTYTRPPSWRGQTVPEVLLSGNHGEIAKWRKAQSEKRTMSRRPELISSRKKPKT